MAYRINEIFYSLQGEGFWTGTPAVFVRFSGCNLRCPFCDTAHQTFTPMSADDIVTACSEASEGSAIRGATLSSFASAPPIACGVIGDADNLHSTGPSPYMRPGVDTPPDGTTLLASTQAPIIVLTGGEPGLQVDEALIEALHGAGYRVHIETNGTVELPEGIDWVTLSPKEDVPELKGDGKVVLERADEIKVVYAEGDDPARWAAFPATWHFLQPCDMASDVEATRRNIAATIAYIKGNPSWRLSLQTHKFLGVR